VSNNWLIVALLLPAGASARTVLDGVYTDAQAKRGAAVYQARCANCHEGADVDGPPLTGEPFIDRWREDSLASLFDFVKAKMPQDAPGKLDEPAYRDLVAYLLQANMYPTGLQELSADSVRPIDFVGHNGPQPLPTNAVVRAIGCFQPGASGTWLLANAAEPKRTRSADHASPEELQSAAAQPLGSQTYRVQNLEDLSGFKPGALNGHRVQVKGVLIRQANNDRINASSVDDVAASCGK
jgi:mono/diheme cytochrome c family protein